VHVELAQDRRYVVTDCLLRQNQAVRDLRVAQSFGEQRQDLQLAVGQAGGVLACAWPRPSRQAARTLLSQPSRDDRRRGSRA
jgi:hypothetical protein